MSFSVEGEIRINIENFYLFNDYEKYLLSISELGHKMSNITVRVLEKTLSLWVNRMSPLKPVVLEPLLVPSVPTDLPSISERITIDYPIFNKISENLPLAEARSFSQPISNITVNTAFNSTIISC